MVGKSEFPCFMQGEKILWSVDGVKVRDRRGNETEEGVLYVTNLRLVFHGNPSSFSKNLKKGGGKVTTLSFYLENVGEIKALRDANELEIEYPMNGRLSDLSCSEIILRGITEHQIRRIVALVEEFKKERRTVSELINEGGKESRRSQGLLSRILEVINPDEGEKRPAKQFNLSISEALRKRREMQAKKEEEELLRIPPEIDVEGELELICPACGEWIKWKPGMFTCPLCKKKINPFTGKAMD